MKKLLCAALTVVSAIALTLSVGFVAKSAQTETWEDINVSRELTIDDSFTLPSRDLKVGGKTYSSSVKLYFPDGSAIAKTADLSETKLTLAGVYRLVFEAKDDGGVRYTAEEKFTVSDKLWKFTKSRSSAVYGHDELASAGTNGLLVKLARGDTLTFGKVIDLTNITKNTDIVSGFITPSSQGSADFDQIVFTFTDVYNPEITLTVQGKRSLESSAVHKGIGYWSAYGNGQLASGIQISGSNHIYHHGDGYGMVYSHSWAAMESDWNSYPQTSTPCNSDNNQFRIQLDQSEAKVYLSGNYMTDLDEPSMHDGEPIWTGFESGKVILTVTALNVTGESANFCITSLLGYDFTSDNAFIETEAPKISIDDEDLLDDNGNYAPLAVVGGSYPVPEATAFDEYCGTLNVKSEVYYNYADEANRIPCLVRKGRFNVDSVGTYTIVYTATDYTGNTTKVLRAIRSVSSLSEKLAITIESEKTSAICGEQIALAKYTTVGGSGTRTTTITATLGNEKIDVTSGTFMPEKAGEWTIKYVVTDITGTTAETSYKINVTASNDPVFTEDAIMPRYIISGLAHVVPEVYATDYSSGTPKKVLATLEVTDKNGTKAYTAGSKYTPVAKNSGDDIILTFKANNAKMEKRVEAVVITDSDNMLEIEKLFVGDGFTTQKSDNGLEISASDGGDVSWIFANPVAANGSGLIVKGISKKDNFKTFEVTFTDSQNANIAVTAKIRNVKNKNARVEFGDADRDLSQGFALADNTFDINYTDGKFYIGKVAVTVASTDNGEAFNGFPSGKVYVSVNMTGAKQGDGYLITKFDNNVITNLAIDGIVPRIAINGDYGGLRNIGDVYTLNSAIASDTVDPFVTFTVTVRTPSGEIVKDLNGKELNGVDPSKEYQFRITESGQYDVAYLAIDSNSNKGRVNYKINILDKVLPEITLSNSSSITAKVGESVLLPVVSVSDNITAAENIVVCVTMTDYDGMITVLGEHERVISGNVYKVRYNYTFRNAGKYTFSVLAIDEAGNQALAQVVITVTE